MATSAKKISELDEVHTATGNDFIVIVNDTDTVPSTKKMAVKNLFGNSSANVHLTSMSPANSTMTVIKAGTLFYDLNYLYVAVEDNKIKRVALSLF